MKAAFDLAVCYAVNATCVTPLRTGGADGDPQAVLRDSHGRAFLQGSSLAGAFRDWMTQNSSKVSDALFGSPSAPGSLIVSDCVFDDAAKQLTRPRVRIDPRTGAAKNGGKFDVAHISAGSVFDFSLVWLGSKEHTDELQAVESMLSALNIGEIRLGAQKTNGFGRVSLSVCKRVFDMADEKDRQAWLVDDISGARPLVLPDVVRKNTVTFTVCGRAESLLVRASAPAVDESGESYMPNMCENGVRILPGSSIKGAVRSRAAAIVEAAGASEQLIDGLFGRPAAGSDNGLAGRVIFEDVLLKSSIARKLPRIRIDKFTGGVIRKGLFREEPISGSVELCITAPDEPIGCALLLYALRDLGTGLYNLGGGGSIGRGYLTLQTIQIQAPGSRNAVLSYDGCNCSLDDGDGLIQQWLSAWEGAKNENR